ncbi:hypothetical protein GX50_07879 [[Emmonsia] crescens]|uniref:Uncharacterized protein n=1 Tax=[Emmonsia] crescens TaxID=73230 RepID=A0A2B7Z727_9EURO|nr:hypothetical protein GX50_07879 [Emmonsia crescens]
MAAAYCKHARRERYGHHAFLEEKMRRDHIEYPHGVEKYRENGHPTQFPAERQDAILEDPHICELEQQLKLMTLEKAVKTLEENRTEWVQKRLEGRILFKGKALPDDIVRKGLSTAFYSPCQSVKRERLAPNDIFGKASVSSRDVGGSRRTEVAVGLSIGFFDLTGITISMTANAATFRKTLHASSIFHMNYDSKSCVLKAAGALAIAV